MQLLCHGPLGAAAAGVQGSGRTTARNNECCAPEVPTALMQLPSGRRDCTGTAYPTCVGSRVAINTTQNPKNPLAGGGQQAMGKAGH